MSAWPQPVRPEIVERFESHEAGTLAAGLQTNQYSVVRQAAENHVIGTIGGRAGTGSGGFNIGSGIGSGVTGEYVGCQIGASDHGAAPGIATHGLDPAFSHFIVGVSRGVKHDAITLRAD